MRHVDDLASSCRNLPEVMCLRENNSSLIAQLLNAQRDDETLKRIIKSTESESCSDYVLRNGILYKNCDSAFRGSESNASGYNKANT